MSDRYGFGPFELNAAEHTLSIGGRPVTLRPRAFDTLLYLVRHPGRLVTRDELIAGVWGETIVEEGNLHWTISSVRRALSQEAEGTWIETVRGLGYRFVAPVEDLTGEPAAESRPENAQSTSEDPREVARTSDVTSWRVWLTVLLAVLLISVAGWTVVRRRASPVATEAQRLYAEGSERLQSLDGPGARERLKAAVEAQPVFPGAWMALARSYGLLGSMHEAESAALKAVEQSAGLPESQRLQAEATYLGFTQRRKEAADRLRRAYALSGHAVEEGLALTEAQTLAGQNQEALASLGELRREHPELRDDARLDLLEASVFSWTEDYRKEILAAGRGIAAARRQGVAWAEVRALRFLAISRINSGSKTECPKALEEIALARRKAEATGNRFLVGGVLLDLGNALSACEEPARAEQADQEAIDLFREIGALGKTAPVLFNLGGLRLIAGDLKEADRLMREALETCQAYDTLCRERFLHPVGVNRLHRGELAEARRMIEEGIDLNQRQGNRYRVAEAMSYLPDIAAWSGDLPRAVALQRQVLSLRQEIGIPRNIAWAHSDLAMWLAERGQGAEALSQAREAVRLAGQQGNSILKACSQASLALAELAAGDAEAADRESAQAIALLRLPRKPFCSFSIWRIRSRVLLARGQLDAAGALIDEGLDLARRNGFVTYELMGRLLRAQLLQKRGRAGEAKQLAADLAAEARAKGFDLIAQGCAGI